MAGTRDPTIPMRKKARSYPGVDEGTACTQSSFKIGKQAFLYIGTQGGRYKAMFKLKTSMPAALKLSKKEPDCYAVGKAGWVTARFTADRPMPKKLWEAWLDESYQLSLAAGGGKSAKVAGKKSAGR